MIKLLLILSLLVSSELLQANLWQSMRGGIDYFRSYVARKVAARSITANAIREMVGIELNTAGMAMLNDMDVGFVINNGKVTAEVLAELMVCEYSVRVTALTQGKLATAEANFLADVQEQELVTLSTEIKHSPLLAEHSNCEGKGGVCQDASEWGDSILTLRRCSSPVCLGVRGLDNKLSIIDTITEHGSDMTFEDIGQRFSQRWLLAKDTFIEIREALSQVSLHQAQLEKLTHADLQVSSDITSRIIVPKLGHTLSPGLVVLAKVYEFAARVFALQGKEDLVKLSLLSILAMKESPDDNIIMTVSTSEDSYPMRLTDSSLDEIVALYLEQVK